MTEEPAEKIQEENIVTPAPLSESQEYTERITRTIIAVAAGCVAGIICFFSEQAALASGVERSFLLPILIMIAAIILQKHIFMLIRINTEKLEKKDWFYQGFITFAFWYVTWTIILTETTITL